MGIRGAISNMPSGPPGNAGSGGGGTYRDGRVRTPGPGRPTDDNMRLAHAIQAGLMSYGFDGGRVAGDLMTMPNDLQKRLGEILFAVVGTWAELAPVVVDGYGPSHPLYNECLAARVMLSHLFPNSRAMLND